MIFTFVPEPTVSADFPDRVAAVIDKHGGQTLFVALEVPYEAQEKRVIAQGRAAFGKMRDLSLLRTLRPSLDASMAAMPRPSLSLNTGNLTPAESAEAISNLMSA